MRSVPIAHFFAATLLCTTLTGVVRGQEPAPSLSVTVRVDAASVQGELTPIWRFFGYDEPNYTYMKDGKKLLTELSQLGKPQVYIRCHNLLVSGDGAAAPKWGSTNLYTEDADGKPVYDFTIVDRIFDTYHERGLKPYAQIGFMPEALSNHPEKYVHSIPPNAKRGPFGGGWNDPPKDYGKWAKMVETWVRHCVDRYGKAEVESWYWELWNEPNLNMYWRGTPQEYIKLYDYTADAVKRALPTAKVGGPEIADNGATFMHDFLEHCLRGQNAATGKTGAPLDFISFHAKGAPRTVDGHVRMGIGAELGKIDRFFAMVASFPELKNKPIIIGECDPEGCAACPSTEFPQNDYRNGALYAVYTADSFARARDIAAKHGVNFEGALTWAFEFENQPYFAGFRALASNGLDLPVLNTFRMFAMMSGKRVALSSSADAGTEQMIRAGVHGQPDVCGLAAIDDHKLTVLLWNYHDDKIPGATAAISLDLAGLPAATSKLQLREYRVDDQHSNSYEAWKRMGSPVQPSAQQYQQLEAAGKLATIGDGAALTAEKGAATYRLTLPRQGVALVVATF